MVLRQIQDGKYNVVAPSKWASHKLDYPRLAGGGMKQASSK
jgi:branched-chain amino acid transport system substrate-binding protein